MSARPLRPQDKAALLLQHPANFSWLTVGGGAVRCETNGCGPALFVTPDARVMVCNNVDTPLIFEHEVAGLGFQLKERPWSEPRRWSAATTGRTATRGGSRLCRRWGRRR